MRNRLKPAKKGNMEKPKILTRKTIYESPWVTLHADRVEFPGGHIVERHHCVDFSRQGVAAVVTNEKDEVLLIQSYRYIFDSVEWEIPAGGFEENEDVFEAAKREIREETGYDVSGMRKTYTYYPMTGISNAVFHLVEAKAEQQVSDPDPNEVFRIEWKNRSDIRGMIDRREINDGFTLNGLMFWLAGNIKP
mgnify:CR=1 FL=1